MKTLLIFNLMISLALAYYLYNELKSRRRIDQVIFNEFSRLINQQRDNLKFMEKVESRKILDDELHNELKKNITFVKSTISSFTKAVNKIKSDRV